MTSQQQLLVVCSGSRFNIQNIADGHILHTCTDAFGARQFNSSAQCDEFAVLTCYSPSQILIIDKHWKLAQAISYSIEDHAYGVAVRKDGAQFAVGTESGLAA